MTTLRTILAIQSVPILISGLQAVLGSSAITAPGSPFAGTPSAALHVIGLSSITLGVSQLVLATQAPRGTMRAVLAAMVPTKVMAAFIFWNDGFKNVSIWEAASGVVYLIAVVAARS